MNHLEAAQEHLQALLKMPLDNDDQHIEALCFLADLQVDTEHLFCRFCHCAEIHKQSPQCMDTSRH